ALLQFGKYYRVHLSLSRLAVEVEDITREVDFSSQANTRATQLPYTTFIVYNLDYFNHIQSPQTPYLLYGTSWAVPNTGPLIITWSLSGAPLSPPDAVSTLNTQADSEAARAKVEAALAEFEAVTNLKFIEVARDDSKRVSDFEFIFQNDKNSIHNYYGLADYPGAGKTNIWLHSSSAGEVHVSVLIHEIAHALGLKHAAEPIRGWPSDPNLNSIMNGADPGRRLQTSDIAALQFLYGAPGTPKHQILSRVSDSLQAAIHLSEPLQINPYYNNLIHVFNVYENIGTDTVIFIPTNLDIYRLTDIEVIYSLPAGRFDNDLFTIDADDYEIRFKRSPDYESPHDMAGGAPYSRNNVYELLLFRDIPSEHEGARFSDEYHPVIIAVNNVDETIDAGTQADII
ncbi:MAG: matrixin family metalloprotease, partial [Alphaproteobacteria bacterium]|nr:matrixin family metalloprotease [Alphaproteobacteria bacterium]